MGIRIALEGEDGRLLESVGDPRNVLHLVLPGINDTNYRCLNRIDWYGDTTFNRGEAPQLVAECETLVASLSKAEELAMANQLLRFARRLEGETHAYLKFYGD